MQTALGSLPVACGWRREVFEGGGSGFARPRRIPYSMGPFHGPSDLHGWTPAPFKVRAPTPGKASRRGGLKGTPLSSRRRTSRKATSGATAPRFSDQATMTEYITRHGDFLTIVMMLDDPVYLEEPFVQSSNYELNVHSELTYYPCTVIAENISNEVPHFLPGENPYLTEWIAPDGVPEEAARGGAETIYPEYQLKLRQSSGPVE